jgi:hypothetical protein
VNLLQEEKIWLHLKLVQRKQLNLEKLVYESENDLYQGRDEETVNMNSFKRCDIKSAIARHELEFKHRINYSDWHVLFKDIG